jgi:hypothetical protein
LALTLKKALEASQGELPSVDEPSCRGGATESPAQVSLFSVN